MRRQLRALVQRFDSRWMQVAEALKKRAVFQTVGTVAAITAAIGVMVAVNSYRMAVDSFRHDVADRTKTKHYRAWAALNSATGLPGNAGRVLALQDLHEDGVSLDGINLAGACLPAIDLTGARLISATLDSVEMIEATLKHADLRWASLRFADLTRTSLDSANIEEADLHGGTFWGCTLVGAKLGKANLTYASLGPIAIGNMEYLTLGQVDRAPQHVLADLSGADLRKANLDNARLSCVNLTGALIMGATLRGANLAGANLEEAHLRGAHLQRANLQGAYLCRAGLLGTHLASACLHEADLEGIQEWRRIADLDNAFVGSVKNAPPGFVSWAVDSMGAVSGALGKWKQNSP